MASAPAWQPVQDAQFSLLAALKAAQSSQRKYSSAQEIIVLPADARLTSSSDFARATKSGTRVTTQHFVGYLYLSPVTNNASAKCGLIISKSVGGSVKRHRVARKVRHAVAPQISLLPTGSLLVIRALIQSGDSDISLEISELIAKLITRSEKSATKS
jgi:ribonuclease P protein component